MPPDPRATLGRGLRVLWRRKWLFLSVSVPIFLLGLAYLLFVPERFVAQAMLLVGTRQPELLTAEQARDPIRGEPDIDGAIALMQSMSAFRHVASELDLVGRPEFALAVRQEPPLLNRLRHSLATVLGASGSREWVDAGGPLDAVTAELRDGISIERIGRSALLRVSYSSSDPALAASIVNTLARYSAEDEGFLSRLSLAERVGFLIVQTTVVAEATPPPNPSLPNPILILGISAVCALVAGLAAVLLNEFRAVRKILITDDLVRSGLRPLGVIPEAGTVNGGDADKGTLEAGKFTPTFLAAVGSLHAAVSALLRQRPEGGSVLLITSSLPREGKSTTAAALATSMAASGDRVLLIDLDLHSPSLNRIFTLGSAASLADSLGPEGAGEYRIRQDHATGVHVLPAGEPHPNPLAVLGSGRLRAQLEVWRAEFDVILLDAPPVLVGGDALMLAQLSDQVIVVTRWGSTTWEALREALRLLRDSGARLAGIALTRVDFRHFSTYNQGYALAYNSERRARSAGIAVLRSFR